MTQFKNRKDVEALIERKRAAKLAKKGEDWTRDEVEALLRFYSKAVELAILRLHSFQTADEQAGGNTKHDNKMGFSAGNASLGTYLATYMTKDMPPGKRRPLTGGWLLKGRRIAMYHAGQLTKTANGLL